MDVIIKPDLFPVPSYAIELLRGKVHIPAELELYWRNFGHGFFIEDKAGDLVSGDVANRLIDPYEVLDLLQNAADLHHDFAHGLPFFETNDRRYLLISPSGQIVSAETELRVVSQSFDEFMHRIVREPFYYDNDAVVIEPRLFPVSPVEVLRLEAVHAVPAALKSFWLECGSGIYTSDTSGNLFSVNFANRLLDPDEVVEILAHFDDRAEEFSHGLPFFEMNDYRYLLMTPAGQIVSAEIEFEVICTSLDEFMYRIVREPLFYDYGAAVE